MVVQDILILHSKLVHTLYSFHINIRITTSVLLSFSFQGSHQLIPIITPERTSMSWMTTLPTLHHHPLACTVPVLRGYWVTDPVQHKQIIILTVKRRNILHRGWMRRYLWIHPHGGCHPLIWRTEDHLYITMATEETPTFIISRAVTISNLHLTQVGFFVCFTYISTAN